MKDSSEIVIGKELDDVNNALYALWKTDRVQSNIDMYLLAMCNADCSRTTVGVLAGEPKSFFRNHCKMQTNTYIPIKSKREESYVYLRRNCDLDQFGELYRDLLVTQQIGAEQTVYRLFNITPTVTVNSGK